MWNRRRAPPARRLRLRDHAVQLHLDRGQPADRARRCSATPRHVEAGEHLGAVELLPDEDVRGGRPAPGVINFVPGSVRLRRQPGHRRSHASPACTSPARPASSRTACGSRSATTSRSYGQYPRIVGETGGKDFVVRAPLRRGPRVPRRRALVRGAFEYQGQKCSAASRAYIPKSLWPDVRDRRWCQMIADIKMGDVLRLLQLHGRGHRRTRLRRASRRPSTGAKAATRRLTSPGRRRVRRLRRATSSQPTVVEVTDPQRSRPDVDRVLRPAADGLRLRRRRLRRGARALRHRLEYGLTGAIFATDRAAVIARRRRCAALRGGQLLHQRQADRCAVVGQQPFGGSPRIGHERQGGEQAQPAAVGLDSDDQGDLRPAGGLPLPVHGVDRSPDTASTDRVSCVLRGPGSS